jgi:catechol 2,3-dioxygenase-like lactoylglutathione lyase family enzyme
METYVSWAGTNERSCGMIEDIDTLVTSYERGRVTRRQLLQALAVMSAPAAAGAQPQQAGLIKGRNLHHVNVRVSNLARSELFYRRLFGLAPTRVVQGPDNHGFDLPGGGIVILQQGEDRRRIDHFCIGVDSFDAERMRAAARAAGIGEVQGNAADNFWVTDPDGLRVQISSFDWPA